MNPIARVRLQAVRALSFALLTLLACSSTLSAQTLMWTANTETDLAGYVVQYGTQSGNPTTSIDVGNVTSRQMTGLQAGSTYYMRVVAYNASGQQSTPSAQVSYAVSGVPTAPTVTSFTPTSGPATGGTVVTITGTNFATGATVHIGGVLATSITLVSSTQLRATTPAGTAGARSVQVTNTNGQSATAAAQFTYTATSGGPTITSVSPTSGPVAGGTTITITGANYVMGAGGEIRVGGVLATGIAYISSTQLRAVTPAGTAGARDVLVRNPNGVTATLTGGFTYTAPASTPTLTSVAPSSGPTAGATTITVTGTNFVSGATVRVGGTAATNVTFVSATQVTARTPAGTAGARDVQITNPNAVTATLTGGFTYTAPASTPTLTSVAPSSGPTAGATTITVTGTNFVSGATVRVGGTAATNVTFVSATQVTARTPAGTAGARDVQITNPNGVAATRTGGFTYTAPASTPTLTSVAPSSGPTAGATTITVTGTNFVSGATVRVGGTAATNVTFVSATQVTARTPAGTAGARDVQITNPNGQVATRTGGFTYTTTSTGPTITAVTPSSGPATGGTTITITGANYVLGSGGEIRVGGQMCTNIQYINSTQLRATTPSGTVGAADVLVRNPNGVTVTRTGGFTYTSGSSLTQNESSMTDSSMTAEALSAPVDGVFRRYLAEGIESNDMTTRLAIANAQTVDAHVTLTFETSTGAATELAVEVPARSRRTLDLSTVPALAGQSFSTRLESDQPVALDRLVSWDASGLAASLESAVDQPATSWFFAEGSTIDPLELFYLVQNPGTAPARIEVRYLLPDGLAPVVRTYTVAAGSRATIWVDREDAALATTDVAAQITSVDGSPIVVERSLYIREAGSTVPRGGDTSVGVTAPSAWWFLEGETGEYTMRLLLANPGNEAAQVQATFQRQDGRRVVRSYTMAPNSRQTVDVAAVHPSLTNAALGITLESSAPIVAERTKWWGTNGTLDDAVSGSGTTSGGARWILAEGELGGARDAMTTVALFNQGAATDVVVTLLFEDGAETSASFPVGAGARFDVPMARAFPSAADRRFSILVEGVDPAANLIVDRSIFWHVDGGTRTAGADGAAARLQ